MRKLLMLPIVVLAGCTDLPINPPAADAPALLAKSGGSTSSVADVLHGDSGLDPLDASVLSSTCPGEVGRQWHVNFGHTECLIVRPAWTSASYAPYELRDDVKLIVTVEKGKNGRITHVTLLGQDVIGDAGIAHETDAVAVAIPVTPDKAGFVLHVHATDVPVWRRSGHTGGDRVEVVGTIDIGDVVYR